LTNEIEQRAREAFGEDVVHRAKALIEREDLDRAGNGDPPISQDPDTRLRNAVLRVHNQNRQAAIAQEEKQDRAKEQREAEFQAQYLSQQRYELAEQLEAAAAHFNHLLSEYQSVHRRHMDARVRAGHPYDPDNEPRNFLPGWFAQRFGGHNSITGVQMGTAGDQDITTIGKPDLPLFQLDPLASPGPSRTRDGAA